MADRVVIQITSGTPERTDGLCTHCLLPALVTVPMVLLGSAGVSTIATWTGCSDCWTVQRRE